MTRQKVALPLRAQPETERHPATPLRPHVEHEYEPHEVKILERLRAKLDDPDPEVRQTALNEIQVMVEIKEFFDGAHIAKEGEMAKNDPEFEQMSMIDPALAETTLPLPGAIRERLREGGQASTGGQETPAEAPPEQGRQGNGDGHQQPPEPPEEPPTESLPEIPEGEGEGWTAMEVAEKLGEGWRRRESFRRRVQELNKPYRMLTVIGRRPGDSTGRDNQVYVLNEHGREALASWDSNQPFRVVHLVRSDDPDTAQEAARNLHPGTDFHTVLTFYASGGASS